MISLAGEAPRAQPIEARLVLLLDHDNVDYTRFPLEQLITEWLSLVSNRVPPAGVTPLQIRAYGGWYRDDFASVSRYHAAEFYERRCPSLLVNQSRYYRISFEFADYLLLPPSCGVASPRITHSVVLRAAAQQVKVKTAPLVCDDPDCEIASVRRWINRRRACSKSGCQRTFSEMFQREEQKQVDVHLALDLVTLSSQPEVVQLGLVSDDADLVPALLLASLGNAAGPRLSVVRMLREDTYAEVLLAAQGVSFLHLMAP